MCVIVIPMKRRFWRFISRKTLVRVVFVLCVVGLFFSGFLALWISRLKIPDFGSFTERKISQSTKIYDRTGNVLLYNASENVRRTVVPLSGISRHIKNATVAIEDSKFYEHRGFRPIAIIRAFMANVAAGKTVQGGSTITQQVVKNTLLTKEKRLSRKLKELVLALKLERVMSKEKILEIYLNESPYGGTIYGVEEASQSYFGKSAVSVTLGEAAYLAALPRAPTYYSPYGNHRDDLEKPKNERVRFHNDPGKNAGGKRGGGFRDKRRAKFESAAFCHVHT